MKILDLRLVGIRCFEDTGDIQLDPRCNIFVGKNNAGKSSLLKAVLALQGFPFGIFDLRPGHESSSFATALLSDISPKNQFTMGISQANGMARMNMILSGSTPTYNEPMNNIPSHQPLFHQNRPNHQIVPFIAKRKAAVFGEGISLSQLTTLDGTFSNLYNRIDLLAVGAHPKHSVFHEAVMSIIGLPITTTQSSGGKVAGFYFNDDNFVPLDRMGDGVTEMVALIVELCIEENRIFVLEEPETNLHPSGLKALLSMVRQSSKKNQFFIATHSNVVVRELSGEGTGKVFRVYRDGDTYTSPSKIEEVEKSPSAHMELLRELGYEFADFELHDAWLFLEEASAERIFVDVLIPLFAPGLRGKLRTFSSGGVDALEPSVADFERLMVFIHLQPVYQGRLWVRADGDEAGAKAIAKIRSTFPHLSKESLSYFELEQFELYFPTEFQEKVKIVLKTQEKKSKRKQKLELLLEVIAWTNENVALAKLSWGKSAAEPIKLLRQIESKLNGTK